MADVNANIGVNIDASDAIAQLKSLQRQLSQFHTSIAKSSEAAALAQRDMQRNLINSINSIGTFSAELRTIKTTSESFTDSLERNKFSMREYFRYAAASTKTFGKLFTSEFNTISAVAEDRVKRLQTQYIKMGRDATGAMKAIAVIPNQLDLTKYSTQLQLAAQRQALFTQLVKQGSTNLLNFGKNTQWAGRQLMVGFTIPLGILGNTAARTFMEMETAAIKFKKVYGDLFTPAAETKQALADVQALGQSFTRYGIAVSQTVGLAAEAAAAGFQGLDLQRQVTEATRLQVLGQVEQQKALETTISLQNAFRMSSEDLSGAINFLNAVENQTVVSLDDITTAIPKAAPIVQELGGDVKDLAFFMAAMKEGGINASEGANALKSGLASLINPTDKAREMMQGFGIDIDAIVNRNAGNVKQTVIEFAQAIDGLTDLNRQRAIEQLFGKFQQARLSALFDNVIRGGNQAARVLELAGTSTEELAALAENELGITADSAMNKFRKSVEDLKLTLVPVGEVFLQTVTPIIESIGNILERFNDLSPGVKKAITILTVAIGAIGPVALMTFGLVANGIANAMKFVMLLRNGYLRLTGQSQILGEQTQYLNNEQLEAAAVAHSLNQSHAKLTQTFNVESTALNQLAGAYSRANAAAKAFAFNNPGMMLPGARPKKYAQGVVSVPGPKGAGDVVPAMLSPGEAVIPAAMVKKYAPLIDGMVAGNIPGFNGGLGSSKRPSMTGGQSLFYSGLAMMAPGNTAGSSFGMNRSFFEEGPGFGLSLLDAMSGGAFVLGKDTGAEKRIKVTDEIYEEYTSELRQYSEEIVETLRSTADSSDSMSQILAKSRDSLDVTFGRMREAGGKAALAAEAVEKHMFYPGVDELSGQYGEVRAPTIRKGKPASSASFTRTPFVEELGRGGTSRFQSPVESFHKRTVARNPALANIGASYAHVNDARLLGPMLAMTGRATAPGALTPEENRLMRDAIAAKGAQATAAYSATEIRPATRLRRQATEDARTYEEVIEQNTKDIYVESRDRTSPHPLAAKDGKDDATAYANARDKVLSGRKGRRSASSAGGTVGAGGVIIPPVIPPVGGGAGGGTGGDGPRRGPITDRKMLRQAYRENRFRQVRGVVASPGFGMAASTATMAAAMMPGKVGQVAQAAMPAVFGLQALQMALKLPIPHVKAFAAVALAGVGIFKLVNAQLEKNRMALEGLGDAATLTADKAKTLGNFFGVAPQTTRLERSGPSLIVNQQTRTQLDALRGDQGFQKDFAKDIQALKGSTDKQAEVVLKSLAVQLKGKGFAKEQIDLILKALQEEAGKTSLKLDFASIDLSTEEGQKELQKTVNALGKSFGKQFADGYSAETKSGINRATGEVVTWTDEKLSKGLKKSLNTTSKAIAGLFNGLSGQLENGSITIEQFNTSFESINNTIAKMPAPQGMLLMNSILKNMPGDLAKAAIGMKNLSDKTLLAKAAILGIGTITPAMIQTLQKASESSDSGLQRAATRVRAKIRADMKAAQEAMKIVAEESKKLLEGDGGGTGEKSTYQKAIDQLTEQRKQIYYSIKAFQILKKNGVDTARAFELSKDPLISMALAAAKTKEQVREILRLAKLLDKASDKDSIINKITELKNTREVKQALTGIASQLKSMGLEASDIENLLSNPDVVRGLTDGMISAADKAKYLQQLVNEITAAKIVDIQFRLVNDPMSLISETASKAQEYFSNIEDYHRSQMESTAEWQATVTAINEANAAIAKGESDIASYQSKINELEYQLKYDPKIGDQAIANIEKQIQAQQDLIAQEEEKIRLIEKDIAAKQELIDKEQAAIDLLEASIDKEQEKIDAVNKLIKVQEDLIDKEQEKLDAINKEISGYEEIIDKNQRIIEMEMDRPIEKLQEESSILSNTLDLISRQEDQINEQYDKRQQALENVAKLNEQINNQKKQQIGLADALTKGDIGAAAQIMQDMRAANAQAALESQQSLLEASRKQALEGVTVGGMTRSQIEERQFQISQAIFDLEQKKKPLLEAIRIEEDKIYNAKLKIKPIEEEIERINNIIKGHKLTIEGHETEIERLNGVIKGHKSVIAGYEKDIEDLNNKIKGHKLAIDGYEKSIEGYEKSIRDIEIKREELNDKIKQHQKAIDDINRNDVEPAKLRVQQNKDIQDAMEKSLKALIDSEKYRDLAKKDWDAIQKSIAAGKLDGDLLAKATAAMQADVSAMVDKWASMPPVKNLTVNVDEYITRYITEVITQIVNQVPGDGGGGGGGGDGGAVALSSGGMVKPKYFARGGRALGSDTVPAMLTPGEFVVNRAATQRFRPLLEQINNGSMSVGNNKRKRRGILGFNSGGLVPGLRGAISTPNYGNAIRSAQMPSFGNAMKLSNSSSVDIQSGSNKSNTKNEFIAPVYNYSVNVSVNSANADPNAIANVVLNKIQGIEAQNIRGQATYV